MIRGQKKVNFVQFTNHLVQCEIGHKCNNVVQWFWNIVSFLVKEENYKLKKKQKEKKKFKI